MKLTLTIPTYWSRPAPEHWRPGDLVFDHPTPLGAEGGLGRLLDSMNILTAEEAEAVIIVVPTSPDIEEEAAAHVRLIARASRPKLRARLLVPSRLPKPAHAELYMPAGYGQVRNCCLLAAALTGADAAVLIDDDEIFELPGFLNTVRAGLSGSFEGEPVRILAGWYMTADGGYRLDKQTPEWAEHWPESMIMDRAFERFIGAPGRYRRTPFAFGGAMAIHRDIYRRIPFDTGIPRGEDIDYLLMARMHGVHAVLDSALHIRHLPPPKSHPAWMRFRQDALRFGRERAKMASAEERIGGLQPVQPEELDPYPGFFLRKDLPERVERTARRLAAHYRARGDERGAAEARRTAELFREAFPHERGALAAYIEMRGKWRSLMESIDERRPEGVLEEISG